MKHLVIVAIAAFFIAGSVSAQHVNIGIKAGLNLYNINSDEGPANDLLVGFHAGALGHIHLSSQWALQPEVMFSTQGAKYTDGGVESKVKLGYVNIPVLVQYMFDNGFRLQVGPQVGFLATAKSETAGRDTDIKSNLETVEFGLGAGVGYVNVATGFGVDARYNLGLSNINKDSPVTSTNRGFQVGLFYLFGHK